MSVPVRYEIHLANLDPAVGSEIRKTRPVVVVSDDLMNRLLGTVVVCPLTSKLHPAWKSRLQVTCEGNSSEVAVDQIRAISKLRLIRKLDQLSESEAQALRSLISEMYGERSVGS